MKYELMLKIFFDILDGRVSSSNALALKYDISPRTVFRYVDCMSLAGIPIYTKRGRYGGFAIMDTFKLPASFLSKAEFEVVISALSAMENQLPSEQLDSAIKKIKAVNKQNGGTVNVKSGHLVIDDSSWAENGTSRQKLTVIDACITSSTMLEINYHDRNGAVSKRIIEPYYVVFKQGIWYTYAYCQMRADFRLFKVGRIATATPLQTHFTPKQVAYNGVDFSKWFMTGEVADICLKVEESTRTAVEEWLGVDCITCDENGVTARARLPIEDSLLLKIIAFNGGVKILQPLSLKQALEDKIINLYNNFIINE